MFFFESTIETGQNLVKDASPDPLKQIATSWVMILFAAIQRTKIRTV